MSPDFASLSSTISIVLGVLTYFLTILLEASRELLKKEVPPAAQSAARKALRWRLVQVLLVAELPLFVSFAGLFYLCLPTVFSVWQTSAVNLWSFDLAKTLFVFLELGVAACFIISIVLGIRLLCKFRRSYAVD